jgi:hypothetical protein
LKALKGLSHFTGANTELFLLEIGHDAFGPTCKIITPPGENPTKGAVISEKITNKKIMLIV